MNLGKKMVIGVIMASSVLSSGVLSANSPINVLSPFAISKVYAADFSQGIGYQGGGYENTAPQPTTYNWTRQSTVSGPNGNLQLHWEKQFGSPVTSTTIDSAGDLYITTEDGKLHLLDKDGNEQWVFDAASGKALGTAIGADGTIYLVTANSVLFAINPDGTRKWQAAAPTNPHPYPAIGTDGTIYLSTDVNVIAYAQDGTTKFTASGLFSSSPAVGSDGSIYTITKDRRILVLNPDGSVKTTIQAGRPNTTTPTIAADGTIYTGSVGGTVDDNNLYAYNMGAVKWTYHTDSWVINPPAIAADGTIYFGSYDSNVYALNPDGTSKWKYATGGKITASPIIGSDGLIYVPSNDGYVYAVNPDGTLNWKFAKTSTIPLAIGTGGILYGGDASLFAIGGSYTNVSLSINQPDASEIAYNSLTLTWSAIQGATQYTIERKLASEPVSSFNQIGQTGNTTFKDTQVLPATDYSYRVTPQFNSTTGNSSTITVHTPDKPTALQIINQKIVTDPATISIDDLNAAQVLNVQFGSFNAYQSDLSKYRTDLRRDLTKTELQSVIDAENGVLKAETTKVQIDITASQTNLSTLVDGSFKTELSNRLQLVQNAIDAAKTQDVKQLVADATKAIMKAKISYQQKDVDVARDLIENLPDSFQGKQALVDQLNEIQNIINGLRIRFVHAHVVMLQWNGVPGATGYRIERMEDGKIEQTFVTKDLPNHFFVDSHVMPSTKYAYRFTPIKNGEEILDKQSIIRVTTVPFYGSNEQLHFDLYNEFNSRTNYLITKRTQKIFNIYD